MVAVGHARRSPATSIKRRALIRGVVLGLVLVWMGAATTWIHLMQRQVSHNEDLFDALLEHEAPPPPVDPVTKESARWSI